MKFPFSTVTSNCSNILLRTSFFPNYLDLKLTFKNIFLKNMVSFIEKSVFHKVTYSNTFLLNTETIALSTEECAYLVTVHDSGKIMY